MFVQRPPEYINLLKIYLLEHSKILKQDVFGCEVYSKSKTLIQISKNALKKKVHREYISNTYKSQKGHT